MMPLAHHARLTRRGARVARLDPIARRAAADCAALPAAGRVARRSLRADPRIPTGGTRRCRRSATARRGWRSSAWRRQAGRQPYRAAVHRRLCRRSCSTRRLLKFGLAEGDYGAACRATGSAEGRHHPQRGQMPAAAANKPLPARSATCRAVTRRARGAADGRVVVALGQIAHTAGRRRARGSPLYRQFAHPAENIAARRPHPDR